MPTLHTMTLAFDQIKSHPTETPWVPLGNFMNDWFGPWHIYRRELIWQPIAPHDQTNVYEHQWATFCAASVLYLCHTSAIECPEWPLAPHYTLSSPWFMHLNQEELLKTTPSEFSERNIYCGDDVYANKYELSAKWKKSARHPQTITHL